MAAFVTGAEIAAWLQRPVESFNSVGLSLAADIATGAIRAHCGWDISQRSSTVVLDGSGHRNLWLPTLHLTSIVSLSVDGRDLNPLTDVVASVNGRLVLGSGFWPRGYGNVTISFIHGYVTVPDAVRGACLALAARTVANPSGVRQHSESLGDWSESWSSAGGVGDGSVGPGLSLTEKADLGPFVLPVVV